MARLVNRKDLEYVGCRYYVINGVKLYIDEDGKPRSIEHYRTTHRALSPEVYKVGHHSGCTYEQLRGFSKETYAGSKSYSEPMYLIPTHSLTEEDKFLAELSGNWQHVIDEIIKK